MSDIHSPINSPYFGRERPKPKLTRQEYMERNLRLQYIKIGLVIFAIFMGIANIILVVLRWR